MGEVDVVQFLLDERANVNARTHHDETPLMEAADHGHQKVAELLIKFEADVNARTVSGKTALHGKHIANSRTCTCREMVALTLTSAVGAGAAATGRDDLVHVLLAAGADKNKPTDGP